MNQAQAYAEAKRRWGDTAAVGADLRHKKYYVFGACSEDGPEDPLEGEGNSWEAAFTDADRRANEGK
jgi:hypothetical protein